MFKLSIPYAHIIAKEMKAFNPNVDWEEVLSKAETKTDIQMLENYIKPKLWVNKTHGEDLDDRLTMYYFMYFTKMFKPYPKIKQVYIMTTDGDHKNIPEELLHLLDQKYSILKRFLNINNIKIISKQSSEDYTIPLYHLITNEKIYSKIIPDTDLWSNVIVDPIVNRVLLSVKLLQLGVPSENIIHVAQNFYFI